LGSLNAAWERCGQRSPIIRRLCDLHDRVTTAGFGLAAVLVGAIAPRSATGGRPLFLLGADRLTYDVGCYRWRRRDLPVDPGDDAARRPHPRQSDSTIRPRPARALRYAIGVPRGHRLVSPPPDHRHRDVAAIFAGGMDALRPADSQVVVSILMPYGLLSSALHFLRPASAAKPARR
jgi:hypothetical protein